MSEPSNPAPQVKRIDTDLHRVTVVPKSTALTKRDRLILNERVKLLAIMLNTVAAGTVTIGVVTPSVAAIWGIGPARTPTEPWWLVVGAGILVMAAFGLHYVASLVLGLMEDPS